MAREVTGPDLLTPAEVAALWRVDPKTVTRWENQGKLQSIRTPGGTRRYFLAEVNALLAGKPLASDQLDALLRGESS
jgi:predicted site-specific integrase-resolvase